VVTIAIDCKRACVCVMGLFIDGTALVGVEYFVIVAAVKYSAHATQFLVVFC